MSDDRERSELEVQAEHRRRRVEREQQAANGQSPAVDPNARATFEQKPHVQAQQVALYIERAREFFAKYPAAEWSDFAKREDLPPEWVQAEIMPAYESSTHPVEHAEQLESTFPPDWGAGDEARELGPPLADDHAPDMFSTAFLAAIERVASNLLAAIDPIDHEQAKDLAEAVAALAEAKRIAAS